MSFKTKCWVEGKDTKERGFSKEICKKGEEEGQGIVNQAK